ncbi:MAG: SDR family NAD(P)-dependent oxidoreductase [Rhodospirillaceae bacterium]|nr:SDR family NAD(P)-dependent oxidoreductase [Rhodospirillaceae bacterium]
MDINGQAAIVTGGASGLGEATARALAANGARVCVLDMNEDGAKAVGADIGGAGFACDVSNAESAVAAIAAAEDAHGAARICVNCAGIAPAGRVVGRNGPMDLEKFAQVINVNLIGSFNITRLAAAAMTELDELDTGERGVIINTASVAAFEAQIGQAAYGASKGGVHAMTIPIARELARHAIRVMAIAPGIFMTPMAGTLRPEYMKEMTDAIPFPKRFGDPSEYARMVETIVTNPMLNGETIRIDGGLRMH